MSSWEHTVVQFIEALESTQTLTEMSIRDIN
jgi:hypothetical protein